MLKNFENLGDFMKIFYSANIAWQDYFETIYIFNEQSRDTFLLEGTARQIWLTIETNNDIKNIVDLLSNIYNVGAEVIERDCIELLNEMKENGLIDIYETT